MVYLLLELTKNITALDFVSKTDIISHNLTAYR